MEFLVRVKCPDKLSKTHIVECMRQGIRDEIGHLVWGDLTPEEVEYYDLLRETKITLTRKRGRGREER